MVQKSDHHSISKDLCILCLLTTFRLYVRKCHVLGGSTLREITSGEEQQRFFVFYLKFVFSKKATKIDEIFTVDLTLCSKCQIDGENILENMNFDQKDASTLS